VGDWRVVEGFGRKCGMRASAGKGAGWSSEGRGAQAIPGWGSPGGEGEWASGERAAAAGRGGLVGLDQYFSSRESRISKSNETPPLRSFLVVHRASTTRRPQKKPWNRHLHLSQTALLPHPDPDCPDAAFHAFHAFRGRTGREGCSSAGLTIFK